MTLTQLRTIVAIFDAGLNVTVAAERIHATQSGLSKQLRQLESELGFLLFRRRGKSLESLTAEGVEVVERARLILAEAERIRELSHGLRRDNGGLLTISTSATLARTILPQALSALQRDLPQMSVRVRHATRAEALTQLTSGETDMALVSVSGEEPPAQPALPVLRWQRVAVVPRSHPLAELRRISMLQLARHPLVSYDTALDARSSLRKAFVDAGFELRIGCTAQDADLIKTYVRSGLGVGVLAEMSLGPEDADLVVLPLSHLLPVCTTWLVPRADRALSRPIDRIMAALAPQGDRVSVRRWLAGDRGEPVPGSREDAPLWNWPEPRRLHPSLQPAVSSEV